MKLWTLKCSQWAALSPTLFCVLLAGIPASTKADIAATNSAYVWFYSQGNGALHYPDGWHYFYSDIYAPVQVPLGFDKIYSQTTSQQDASPNNLVSGCIITGDDSGHWLITYPDVPNIFNNRLANFMAGFGFIFCIGLLGMSGKWVSRIIGGGGHGLNE